MDTTQNPKNSETALSREIAELDALMNVKESFAKRIGLIPFTAGAAAAIAVLAVMQLITRL